MKMFSIILLSILILASCDARYSEHRMEPLQVIGDDHQNEWLAYLDKQIRSSPRKSEYHYRKALILSEIGGYDEALQLMRRAIVLSPDYGSYRYLMAKLLFHKQDYAAGLREARLAESYGMISPSLYELMGALYLQVGELGKSNEYLKKALAINPQSNFSQLYSGFLSMAQGDTLAAEEAISKSLALNYSLGAMQALIEVAMFKKDYEQAFEHINHVLITDSLNTYLLLKKADLFRFTGRMDSAKSILGKLIRMDSLQPEYHHRLGQIYFITTRFDSASYHLNKVLQVDNNNTEALLTLARINDRRGFHGPAIDLYKQILVVDSTFQVAKDELDKLNNRMAYLQRLRREKEQIQNLQEIQPRPILKPQL